MSVFQGSADLSMIVLIIKRKSICNVSDMDVLSHMVVIWEVQWKLLKL